jgi:ornithine cyclodeaminase
MTPRIFQRSELEAVLVPAEVIQAVEAGFAAYSRGEVVVPPVGALAFDEPPGDLHIKYGVRRGAATFVIKVATSFYHNPRQGLSSSSGLVMVFSALTGFPVAILFDGGYLTELRTAAAGAIAAKYLAPRHVRAIGIIGAGIQAHLQVDLLRHVTDCRHVVIWARDEAKARTFQVSGFTVEVAASPSAVLGACNLVVTTTPSATPLLWADAVQPGTHITALGADGFGKQELDAALIAAADVRVVDSRSQCFEYGDSAAALKAGLVSQRDFIELGEVIANPARGRTAESQVTVADLTGVAVQDIQIADLACSRLGVSL